MSSHLLRLQTPRLELIAASVEILQADLAGRTELAAALGVEVPEAWPPENWERGPIEFLLDWMQKRPDAPGWFAWYCTLRGTGFQPVGKRRTGFQPVGKRGPINNPPIKSATRQVENLSYEERQIENLSYEERQVANLSHGMLIGGLGFIGPPNAAGEAEIGYSLLPEYHRQGYCPEGLSALIDWAFSHPKLQKLVVRTPPLNRPSIRVLEKLGFQYVGPGRESNVVEYALKRGNTTG